MRIAFYAPMKPPDDPVPSGDRRMARLLMEAMRKAGHKVDVAAKFKTREGSGDPVQQRRILKAGEKWAERLVDRYRRLPEGARPNAWFTYHLYYKAPDVIGPIVADRLEIPYVIAEASHAPKRADGPWALFHRANAFSISRADGVLVLNPVDSQCTQALLKPSAEVVPLKPFLDLSPYSAVRRERLKVRQDLAVGLGLDLSKPWLIATGMMRKGAKMRSYEALAKALTPLVGRDWQLLIVGDGPERQAVETAFRRFGDDKVAFLGLVEEADLPRVLSSADLMVWPAVDEAFCMALLESQAAATPVVAGAYGGVPELVADGTTGRLTPPGDLQAFTGAVSQYLQDPKGLIAARDAARTYVQAYHGLAGAARILDTTLRRLRKAHHG